MAKKNNEVDVDIDVEIDDNDVDVPSSAHNSETTDAVVAPRDNGDGNSNEDC